jgi:hypothetical protein
MTKVFVSYRRDDSKASTGRIADRLRAQFGESAIFQDIESIKLGVDFRTTLSERLDQCDVFLAIIGDEWAGTDEGGGRRIDRESDAVRQEVAAALARKSVPVIPVLVGDNPIPAEEDLPDNLKELHYRNAIKAPSDDTFNDQMEKLIEAVEEILAAVTETESQEPAVEVERTADTDPAPAPVPTPSPETPVPPKESGGGSGKAIVTLIVIGAVSAAAWYFWPREVDIRFQYEGENPLSIEYGDEHIVRLQAVDSKGERIEDIPDLDGQYEFRWENTLGNQLSVGEFKEEDEPYTRVLSGIPLGGADEGSSVVTVVIKNLNKVTTRRMDPITVTISYDETAATAASNITDRLTDIRVSTTDLISQLETLVPTKSARLRPGTVDDINEMLTDLRALAKTRIVAESADPDEMTVGRRLKHWLAWDGQIDSIRDIDGMQIAGMSAKVAALQDTTRLVGELQTYESCSSGSPPSCTNQTSNFTPNDRIFVKFEYLRSSADGSEILSFEVPGHADNPTYEASQLTYPSYHVFGARQAGEYEIRMLNGRGDLIGKSSVTVRN